MMLTSMTLNGFRNDVTRIITDENFDLQDSRLKVDKAFETFKDQVSKIKGSEKVFKEGKEYYDNLLKHWHLIPQVYHKNRNLPPASQKV